MDTTAAVIRLALIGAMVAVLVGGLLAVLVVWYLRGRDPHAGLVADEINTPPDDLPPGADGTLLDEHADREDVVATLLGLGRKGAVAMEATSGDSADARDYVITLLHPERITTPLEQNLLQVLFGSSPQAMQETRLSEVRQRFPKWQSRIRDDLYAALVRRGYFDQNPHTQRVRWKRISWIGMAISVVLGLLLAFTVDPVALAPMVAAVIIWGVMVRMSRHMPRKTKTGAEAAAKWRAFRRYLESIAGQRDLAEASEIFDRYFAYAVAFGIDRSWIRSFSRAGAVKPGWFGGPDIGDVVVVGEMGDVLDVGGTIGHLGGHVGDLSVPDVSMPDFSVPDMQGMADFMGGSLQGASDGLSGLLDAAGSIFDGIDFDI